MVIKYSTHTPARQKLSTEQSRKFDILMYIILTIVVVAISVYTS